MNNIVPLGLQAFDGEENELSFPALLPVAVGEVVSESRPVWISYRLASEDNSTLYRIMTVPGISKSDSTVLCQFVDTISFFYSVREEEGQSSWQKTLTALDRTDLPQAIRVRLSVSDKESGSGQVCEFDRTIFLPLTRFASHENE